MSATPPVEEVIRVAKTLGMTLGPEEAGMYRDRLAAALNGIEGFMRMRMEEARPALLAPERVPGHRPSSVEDRFNAWLWKCDIKEAETGLLAGKTVSFKDHIAVGGVPLTLGSYFMEGYVPDFDATIVTRVLAAGGTVIGKNSMDGPTNGWGNGVPSDYQRPLNPHNPDHCTGGSSSGSAVAVAAGEVDVSFGGDQAGSIRIPAAFCGVYGLKPTFGLVPHFGIGFGSDQSIDCAGPIARDIEDVAAALDAVAGYDSRDQRQDRTVPARFDTLSSLTDGIKGVRIGVLKEGFIDAEVDVRDAVLAAVDVLVGTGATAADVSIPEHRSAALTAAYGLDPEGARAVFDIGFFGAFAKTHYPATWISATHLLYHEHTDDLIPRRKLGLIASEFVRARFHGSVYAKAQNVRSAVKHAFDTALDRVDVLVMPTCLGVAPEYTEPANDHERLARGLDGGGFELTRGTRPYNFTGHPALTVPCGKSGGLPIGMQLVARYYGEPLLVRTAYAFQHSVNWEELTGLPAARTQSSSA